MKKGKPIVGNPVAISMSPAALFIAPTILPTFMWSSGHFDAAVLLVAVPLFLLDKDTVPHIFR